MTRRTHSNSSSKPLTVALIASVIAWVAGPQAGFGFLAIVTIIGSMPVSR